MTALCALFLAGCGPDDERLVDVEAGTWVVSGYDLEGDGTFSFKEQSCSTAAVLKFIDSDVLFVARNKSLSNIADEACLAAETDWFCSCFSYSYDGSTQTWVEFAAGDPPADPDGQGATTIALSKDDVVSDRYIFSPLPAGLFSSDGESSAYLFARKAESVAESAGCEAVCLPPA